ncbi:hypothetical protein U1Q18_033843 [Sarracenia purpurea var. burkii]
MGKYMRKAKITADVAVMEVVSQSSIGVRTRAKTHALQRLQSINTPPPPTKLETSYLQLRSRRLEKVPLPPPNDAKKLQSARKDCSGQNPNPNSCGNLCSRMSSRLRPSSVNSGSVGSVSISCSKNEDGTEEHNDLGIEASFGENNLDFEGRERNTRESTPCSFMRESDTTGTPCSTTRRTASTTTNPRIRNAIQTNIPTTHEMDDFFAHAEQHQQRLFTEKYNFDIVNDSPLPGRYEWVRVNH